MGTASSKFCKYIKHGNEVAALQLLNNCSELRKAIDPNATYKGIPDNDTPLHCVCRHAMISLVRIFMTELGGNPNVRNAREETSLHCLCAVDSKLSDEQESERLKCLILLLNFNGNASSTECSTNNLDLGATDCKGNTVLHCAAASGMKNCVELLVTRGASVFSENCDKEVPCDVAEKNGNPDVALYLESKMVFSEDAHNTDELDVVLMQMEADDGYCGLRAQELQEAKDHLIVETSDMLQVPLFTAEALLRNHEWSRESMLESWIRDPIACCHKCGVNEPKSLSSQRASVLQAGHTAELHPSVTPLTPANTMCGICAVIIPSTDEPVLMPCCHQFCKDCWERYLNGKIQDGEAHHITCPGYQCDRLVPVELIEALVSRDMARRYLQFDIKAFVDSNPDIKWCPFPGCGRAVRLPVNNALAMASRSVSISRTGQPSDWSWSVDCGSGHTFCWECLGDAHDPASCENWKNWHLKIADIKPEELDGTEEEMENSANCLWLVTNSKPCSNCKSPIQKNEGCNHIKCSKCKHDFCWVCLESWKKHSTATGGYFRCNRYEVVRKVEEQQETLKTEAELKNKKVIELNRFVHYYSRFKNHENSYKLEMRLYETAKSKMEVLARAMIKDDDLIQQEIKFIQGAVTQLLKARHVLKCSYAYGYYLEQIGYKKSVFEFMQTELEECTEMLSQMISRPYMRTPRNKIVQTARSVQLKRHEFLGAIAKGLVPSDNSPSLKKKHKIFSVDVDEGTRIILLASLSKNPQSAWIKGPSGKHTNVSALLDWPDNSDDSDDDYENQASPVNVLAMLPSICGQTDAGGNNILLTDQDGASSSTSDSKCKRSACRRVRVINPRTGQLQEYCSIKCKNMDQQKQDEPEISDHLPDFNMDLLRALEMSRIQFLFEAERAYSIDISDAELGASAGASYQARATSSTVDPETAVMSIIGNDINSRLQQALEKSELVTRKEEQDMCLAMELSMKELTTSARNSNTLLESASRLAAVSDLLPIEDNGCNGFGVIKDLKINNILSADADKTEQFQSKNFKHIFGQSAASTPISGWSDMDGEQDMAEC